jgi:hypothetical protein
MAVAFLLWVLWNLTLELMPARSLTTSQKVIPIRTFAYRPPRVHGAHVLQMGSRG